MDNQAAWERSWDAHRGHYHWFAEGAERSLCGQFWRDYECQIGEDGSTKNCRTCERRRGVAGEHV